MKGWQTVALGELFDITSSKRVFQSEWQDSGVPFYRAREIVRLVKEGFVENELFISEEMYESYKLKYGVPNPGDLLITGVGTLGICYVVRHGDRFYFKDGNIIWLKNKGLADPRYVYHALLIPEIKRKIEQSSGTTVGTFTIQRANEIKIPLPSLPEQKRIAAILDKADAIRRKREKAIELTDSFLRSVFLEMFGDPVSNPKGFQIIKIGELLLANPNNGVFRKNDDYDGAGLPVAWVKELFDGHSLDLTESRRLTPTPQEMERYSLSNGDILFCRSSLKREGTGYSNVFLGEDRTALFECHLIRIRPNPSMIDSSFFNFQLRLPSMRQRMLSRCNTVTMSTIGQNVILDLLVMVPPLKLQRQFSALLVKTCALHKKMDSTVGIITQLAGSLSNKLFTTRSIPITAVNLQEAHAL